MAAHPVVRMWRRHELGAICDEWIARGHAGTVLGKLVEYAPEGRLPGQDELERPGHLRPWLGDERILRSHRSALLRKNREWYRPRFRDVPDDLPYYWPDARFDTRTTG
jgi:hypothetical protein